jgi:hypothetical protein
VPLVFCESDVAAAPFACEIGPLFPGLLIRTTTTRFPAPSWVTVESAPACCSVDASCPPEAPAGAPAWVVEASFELPASEMTRFVCEMGPLSPGLFTRIDTTTFVGWFCVAELPAPAV